MKSLVGVVLAMLMSAASADVIDPFTAAQGPIEVGPGGAPTEEEAILVAGTVLGGFRILGSGVDDEAPAGAFARVEVGGGELRCETSDNRAGCTTGYDRSDGPAFDFSGAGTIEFDILEADGALGVGVGLVDVDENVSFALLLPPVAAGRVTIDLATDFPPPSPFADPPADLSRIDAVLIGLISDEEPGGNGFFARMGPVTTAGPIGRTEVDDGGDDGPSEADFRRQIGGNYFAPDRDGEGCQLTLEGDGVTFIMTCYVYLDGEQVWLVGPGQLTDGGIVVEEMILTTGADFGSLFNPADVVVTVWGRAEFIPLDCNNAVLSLESTLPEFGTWQNTLTKIVPGDCSLTGDQIEFDDRIGNWFDASRDGEGFQMSMEAGRQAWILTWYTYFEGKQLWMIGTGTENGNLIEFDEMYITGGADFGFDFRPEEVTRELWGSITLEFTDCNNAVARVRPMLPGFEALDIEVTRIVAGSCDP